MKNLPIIAPERHGSVHVHLTMMVPAAAGGAGCDAIDVSLESHRHNTAVFDLGSIGTRTLAANGN